MRRDPPRLAPARGSPKSVATVPEFSHRRPAGNTPPTSYTSSMSAPAHPLQARYLEQRTRGELAAAAETLKTVLKGHPRADWAYNERIELFYKSGRHADAQTLARTALRVNPLNAQGHNLYGTILSQLNDLPSGEWHFRRAIELGGEQAPFLANLALNLMQQGRTDEAESCFARAHALAPDDFRTLAHWSKLR